MTAPADWFRAHTLLAIDPGNRTGWATFVRLGDGWGLTGCGVATPARLEIPMGKFSIVVIETPVIYPNSPVPPNDICKLSRTVGRYEERFASRCQELKNVTPREWKGTVNGDIMVNRIRAALKEPELRVYMNGTCQVAESFRHNAIDAIGLGKWAVLQSWVRNFHLRPIKA